MPRTPIRIGGVDPAVIRELSGIYKPFVNAFKELISNSYDADADRVEIRLAEDYTEIEIYDDGRGLTPDEFRTDFTKIGGSQTRVREELTPKERPKIGSKGIGFLAVARYCSRMEIVSASGREYKAVVRCPVQRRRVNFLDQIESPLPKDLLLSRIRVESIYPLAGRRLRRLGKNHNVIQSGGFIDFGEDFRSKEWAEVEIEYSIDCSDLEFSAIIDFDYLLSLENKRDLEEIEDFCSLEVRTVPANVRDRDQHYTRITLKGLKDSVVRNLKAGRKHGNVRNIESRSGIDRFIWHLRRSIPAKYELPELIRRKFGKGNLLLPSIKYIEKIVFSGPGYDKFELTRPVWTPEDKSVLCLDDDICVEVDLNAEGIIAKGYILASSEIIYPAEFRGISIRVRNVQIGDPGLLGFERVATSFVKSALSQVTGEINVLQGLDAIDALNPGRESFYEENGHFKLLQNYIVGEKENVGGLLKKIIEGLEKRMQVSAAVEEQLSRANQRRKALINIAMAVTHFSRDAGEGLKKLFSDKTNHSNGLALLPESEIGPGRSIQNFRVEERAGQDSYTTDFINRIIYFDPKHDRWSRRISLLGEVYEVVPKDGGEKDPWCQIDLEGKKIFVNWGHPLRQQMGEAAFLKSSVAWRVAYHASQGDIESMMELYLKLFTYNES